MTEDAPSKLVEQVDRHIREAMKARDQATLAPLRMLKAALLNRRVEKGQSLEDREFVQVVASLVKQRRDAIAQFTAGGRQDLADTEAAEITVLAAYLPPPPRIRRRSTRPCRPPSPRRGQRPAGTWAR